MFWFLYVLGTQFDIVVKVLDQKYDMTQSNTIPFPPSPHPHPQYGLTCNGRVSPAHLFSTLQKRSHNTILCLNELKVLENITGIFWTLANLSKNPNNSKVLIPMSMN